ATKPFQRHALPCGIQISFELQRTCALYALD
ncbi:hypothetical protein N499_1317B, partial [Wolbachia pipientis wVitA]